MGNLFKQLKFLYTWRSYQDKLLRNFSLHIADNHFHVIAPPGSGKTLLGLEIVKRLHKKTLILSPTLTIRNQWEDRLQRFFTKDKSYTNISFDIKNPNDITFSTYQSFQAFYTQFKKKELFFSFLKKHKIEILVLDEAHHLKNTWWNSLYEFKISANNLIIVALTATPPYDSTSIEVTKYFKLCGEIDDEIAVPDLVKEGDLAPHQDFVYLSKPKKNEINFIVNFRMQIADFIDELKKDLRFIQLVKKHHYYTHTQDYLETIYTNPSYFSSLLIFLNDINIVIPREKYNILGFNPNEEIIFPQLNHEWIEILLQNLLIEDRDKLFAHEVYLSELELKLKELHVFQNGTVNLIGNDSIYKSLSQNPSKLSSIVTIINSEQNALNKNLRAVVLTDYIRKEFFNTSEKNLPLINKLGVLPIFHYLRIHGSNKETIAVLTGSIIIIHYSVIKIFKEIHGINKLEENRLIADPDFITIPKSDKIVDTITQLFENGTINILIGTKSLLGEGWDAPSINCLILASFVGSFVTSNQMRGRAIREDSKKINKTGNIWHLACLDPTTDDGGKDIETLKRRFNVFMGIANNHLTIENGMERLHLPIKYNITEITQINNKTLQSALNRKNTITQWEKSIAKGYQLTKELRYFHSDRKEYTKQKKANFNDAVKYTLIELFFAISFFLLQFILNNISTIFNKGVLYFMYALLVGLLLSFGLKMYHAIKIYFQYGFIHKKIKKMGITVLNTLIHLGYITSNRDTISIQSNLLDKGNVTCSIIGVTQYESTLFITALEEIVQPIENPRYLIIIKSFLKKQLSIQNFYAVPTVFGKTKKDCEIFQKNWVNELGSSKIFYTRHLEGRKLLLKARLYHISNAFHKVTKNMIVWK